MFYLEKISLKQFRCYSSAEFVFSPHINILYGANASGKTSLVEAIHYLAIGKTFKNAKDIDLISHLHDYMFLKGQVIDDGELNTITISFDGKTKNLTKNNKTYKNLSQYLGYFNIVVFSPDDLSLIKGVPSERRRFLDVNIGQIDRGYLETLIKYRKTQKERNEYLKQNQITLDQQLLDVFDEALIEQGAVIIKKRQEFVENLREIAKTINKQLSSKDEILEIVYNPNTLAEDLRAKARQRRSYDINAALTSWGPHRDDLFFLINGEKAETFSSQGQIRTAALSLKLALAEFFNQKGNKMIVILDDVFSELDFSRQSKLLERLDLSRQTFITTTSIEHIDKELLKSSKLIEMRGENDG